MERTMLFRRREKHVTISAQIEDQWSFHIKANANDAFAALSDWLGIMNTPTEGGRMDEKERVVGFSRPPRRDLGESEADTDLADSEADG